ncbi:MAG: type II secretion system F family protein [Gammaproteobacteria bacterium]|jgi:tight adherence protein C|nr:type II secretion system F family protein [Gammaproteobacteria bacterium]
MPIKLSLMALLVMQSLIFAAFWWFLLAQLQHNVWLDHRLHHLISRLPSAVQQRLNNYAVTQTSDKSASQWVAVRLGQGVSLFLLALLPISGVLKASFVVVIAWYVLYQKSLRKQYIRKVIREWPNSLDMTAMLMHSGLSFRATIHAFQSAPNDSAALRELTRVQRAQQSGYSLEQALDAFGARISHPWIQLFIGAVKQAQITGGELAKTLQRQAEQCRQQQLLEAEKRAQEVSVKLMFPLIFCFFPVTMLLILGPVFIGFMNGGMT